MSYFSIVLLVIALMNTYPLFVSRDLIFQSKKSLLTNQASLVAGSVERAGRLNTDTAKRVLNNIEMDGVSCIAVYDALGNRLWKKEWKSNDDGTDLLEWSSDAAAGGNDVFRSEFRDGVFRSTAAVPIKLQGSVNGVVSVFESDREQGRIIIGLQNNLRLVSIIIFAVAVALSLLYTGQLTRRLHRILNAIRVVREGDYGYKADIKGGDELSELGEAFNSLSERLKVNEDVRRRFVSDASHELRTPLTSIKLLSDSILQSSGMDEDTVHEFVEDIGGQAERLTRITEKLLSLTKLDNAAAGEPVPVDIGSETETAVKVVRPIAGAAGVELESALEDGCFVIGTKDTIYQTALNLTENAVKYNVRGGSVYVKLRKDGGDAVLTVEDTGIGIPQKDLPHVFERFYRVDKARSREAGGSGLGLSIVKSAVEEFGGSVTAQNREGGGMCFTVRLPLCDPPDGD